MDFTEFAWLKNPFDAVLRATWQGALLALVVLAATRVLGSRLRPSWRFALWLVVFARLATPWIPVAPWSIYALVSKSGIRHAVNNPPTDVARAGDSTDIASSMPIVSTDASDPAADATVIADSGPATRDERTEARPSVTPRHGLSRVTFSQWLALGWIAGVTILLARLMGMSLRLSRCRARWRAADPSLCDLLRRACAEAGVRRPVALRLAAGDVGPATCGWLHPCIVIPVRLAAALSPDELRLILLHEVIHVRRCDPLIDLVASGIAALHWFNPAAWLALISLRREREFACDAVLLDQVGPAARRNYGSVLLRTVEMLQPPERMAGAVAMFGGRLSSDSVSARIRTIVDHQPATRAARLCGVILLLLLTGLGLTDVARPGHAGASPEAGIAGIATPGPERLPLLERSHDLALADEERITEQARSSIAAVVLDCPDESPKTDTHHSTLRFLSADGHEIKAIGGLHNSQSIGGNHRIAIDAKFSRIYACEISGRVIAYDLLGKVRWSESISAKALAVDPMTGYVWCLTGEMLGTGKTVVVDTEGKQVISFPVNGFDIAYGAVADSFWIVGPEVIRLKRDGEVAFKRPLPEVQRERDFPAIVNGRNWTAVSVAPKPAQEGPPPHSKGVWVAVRAHPDRHGSLNRLILFDETGEAKTLVELGDVDPFAVAVDAHGDAWVADRGKGLLRFDLDGRQTGNFPIPAMVVGGGISADSIWAATTDEVLRLDLNGKPIVRLPFPKRSPQSWLTVFEPFRPVAAP